MEKTPYAHEVAWTWYYVNKFRSVIEAREKLCQMDMNWDRVGKDITRALQAGSMYLVYAVRHADTANLTAISSLSLAVDEMNSLGVYCVPDMPIHRVYEEMWDTLAGVERFQNTTGLAKTFLEAYHMHKDLERIGLASEAVTAKVPLVGTVLHWAFVIVSEISTGKSAYFNAEDYINKSVGMYGSVFTKYRTLWSSYLDATDEMDSVARNIEKRKKNVVKTLEEQLKKLGSYSLQGLTWERIAKITPHKTTGSFLVADPENLVDRARIQEETYRHLVKAHLKAYWMKGDGAYCSLASAIDAVEKLEQLSKDLDQHISALEDLKQSCLDYIRSTRLSSSYAKNRMRGLIEALRAGDLGACGDALALLELDANYRTTESLLAFCESKAEKYPEYSCVGDLGERLDCCMAFLEKKRAELLSSEQYRKYAELRATVEELIALVGDEDVRTQFFSIPAYPQDEKSLTTAVNKLTGLYRKLKREAEKYIQPSVYYEGYLDGEQMSELNIVFSIPVQGADLRFKVDLPFEVYTYRVVEGNGLYVSVSRNKAYLRGSGWTKILVLAYPADFDVDRMGEADGKIFVRVRYDGRAPARYPLHGEVISKSPSVHASGRYLYFQRPGEAVVAIAALEQEWEEDGNRTRVRLKNIAQEPYTGTVFLPVSAEKMPRGCQLFGEGAVCSVRLDPFEEKVFTFTGTHVDVPSQEPLPEAEERVVAPSLTEKRTVDKNTLFSLLDTLRGWYKRAKELGVEHYLSFDGNILQSLEEQTKEIEDQSVVSTYASLLDSMVSGTKRYVRARVASLRGKKGAEKAYALANQALHTKDYMLALALAAAVDTVEKEEATSLFPLLLSFVGLATIGVYARLRGRRPRIRRIPKV